MNCTSYNCEGRWAMSKRWVSRDHTSAAKCHPDSVIIQGSKIRHQDSCDKDWGLRAHWARVWNRVPFESSLLFLWLLTAFLITLSAGDERFDQTSFEPFFYTDYLYDCFDKMIVHPLYFKMPMVHGKLVYNNYKKLERHLREEFYPSIQWPWRPSGLLSICQPSKDSNDCSQ